jgi:hypothetical protein
MDKINIDQFRAVIYRPTPRLANAIVDYELSIRDPKKSTHHSIPREELVSDIQRSLNRYRDERDAGPEGISEHKASVIRSAISKRNAVTK